MTGSPPPPVRNAPGPRSAAAAWLAAIGLAVGLIMAFEGDGGRVGYRDLIGVVTSCYGHTGPGAVVGRRYTPEECQAQLTADVRRHADPLRRCLPPDTPVNAMAAFISLSFNAGPATVCNGRIGQSARRHDWRAACAGLSAYVNACRRRDRLTHRCVQWIQPRGLVRRRASERQLCERGLADAAH